ncbi:NNP family nitrate/nitrite transporter-like MFS transporter [Natronocella acetinitrilica]|uniref:NNP family nitrate/nitrite transporter-like MFS transporter n=1 Tax=Natronocella acetinitrilica TaxID=414046 RepID=A0AAE3KC52_9GAMM|nr:nitrate/nitrite transporter [Natronocella acetinitrilica]MCP1675336.1 NNP family nitrate/nitrite transporter-like MFS transporter [Natronocella acetinitrilica]
MTDKSLQSTQQRPQAVLWMSTLSFTVCFAVWVMFGVIGNPIAEELGLSETQFGILTAMPILSGSLARLPIGMLTDRYGGRTVYFLLMLSTVLPIYLVQFATSYWQLLMLGLLVGLVGASFSVGIAYVARAFPRDRQGFAMGVFGAGNAGAALTNYVAPTLVVILGWQFVPTAYACAMLVMAVAFWLFTTPDAPDKESDRPSLREQLALMRDPRLLKYCQYYSVVFGGYVALSLYLTRYFIMEYGVGLQLAALIATIFVLPSGVIRALGGWFSDRFGAHAVTWWCMWISAICLFIMSYPPTEYRVETLNGEMQFAFGVNIYLFTALLFVLGVAWGFGKASVFKYVSDDFDRNIGVVSGIVGLAGGVGGFLLPIKFGLLLDITGVPSTIFMLLFGVTVVSLVWMWRTERRSIDPRSGVASPAGRMA